MKKTFIVSIAIHGVLLVVFPFLLADFRKREEPEPIEISFYRSDERPLPPALPPAPSADPVPEVQSESPESAVVELPPAKRRTTPPSTPKSQQLAPAPEVAPQITRHEPAPETPLAPQPPQPRPEASRPVRTTAFAQTPAEPRKTTAAPRRAQTAGFGEARPASIPEAPRESHRGAARLGSFEVAATPPENTAEVAEPRRVVSTASFDDQAAGTVLPEPRSRDREPVRSTGFTIEAIADSPRSATGRSGSVSTGAFGDTVAANALPRGRERPAASPDTPVEILVKPNPVYTPEARALHVEGEIVLRVVFVATGELRVLDVVQGLGHGLDESAVEAAKQIEFKPARRDGQPVDYVAVLRIVFQLA